MKKSVLIECERLKHFNSGIANVCKSLIRGLGESDSVNLDFTFYAPEKSFRRLDEEQRLVRWKFWQKHLPVKTSAFDLIHVTHQLSAYFHQTEPHQKRVVTLHDLNYLHDNSSFGKKNKTQKLVQKNLADADAIVCISEFVKKDFLENTNSFQLKKNVEIEVIDNGLIFPAEKVYTSQKFAEFSDKKYILSIGVLTPKKNQKVLLEFVAQTDLHIVLLVSAANNDYQNKFLRKVRELNLSERVHLFFNVTEAEKNFFLQNCESYVHPSLAEGFGIPPIEAMFFGKPVFLSNLTSLPEVGGDSAYYFDNFNAENMLKIYQNGMRDFLNNIGQRVFALKNRARRFDYQTMTKCYTDLYSRLLDGK